MTTKKSRITPGVHSIHQDLIFEILLKLPAKSLLRFKFVSKSWMSIIRSQQFIDSFMLLSLSRPCLLLILNNFDDNRVSFFSSPRQSCSFLSSSSMLVAQHNIPEVKSRIVSICNSVRGFVCFRLLDGFAVCNPITGQFIHFANDDIDTCCYLGYDPNSNQYKVLLVMPQKSFGNEHRVRTLGGQVSSHLWRPIKTNIPDCKCDQNGICIDGVVYYLCRNKHNYVNRALCCFDVGYEQLRLISIPENLEGDLTNYLGKLAVYYDIGNVFTLWVLEDVKNEVWSKNTCVFPSFTHSMLKNFYFEGITMFGEIVYVSYSWTGASYELLCYDVKKKMERTIRIEKLPENRRFHPCLLSSHVDNIIYL